MILVAGIYDPDIERVKALLSDHTFPDAQLVIDRSFAGGDLTVPEWSKAIQLLASEQTEPWGLGTAISAGFIGGYATLFPTAEIVRVKTDIGQAIQNTQVEGYDSTAIARGLVMGEQSIASLLSSIPHVIVDMTTEPSDDEILALLGAREKAA